MKRKIIAAMTAVLVGLTFTPTLKQAKADTNTQPSVSYTSHVQKIGWQGAKTNGEVSGTSGKGLRLEGIKINIEGDSDLGIEYKTHVQKQGWEYSYAENGQMSGTEGKALRLEAITMKLTGKDADKYDIYYRVHVQKTGWQGWVSNGQIAGTTGQGFRLEAIQIKVVDKSDKSAIPTSKVTSTSREVYMEDLSKQTFDKINEYRKQNGKSVLAFSNEQFNRAQQRALLNAKTEGHEHGHDQISTSNNFSGTAEEFLHTWIDSPPHKAAILDDENIALGVAVYRVKEPLLGYVYYVIASFDTGFDVANSMVIAGSQYIF